MYHSPYSVLIVLELGKKVLLDWMDPFNIHGHYGMSINNFCFDGCEDYSLSGETNNVGI